MAKITDNNNIFSIGNYIVDYENIYIITGQKEQADFSGKTMTYFLYEPINKENSKATYSIPIDNILKSGFRPLISQDIAKKLYQIAEEKIDPETIFDFKAIKETIYENNPEKNLHIVKRLFLEKENTIHKFSGISQDIIDSTLKHLSDEIAFVTKESSEKIKDKLISLIQKSIK